MRKITGSGSESESRSISQKYGSADPDPSQNFMDPQHWLLLIYASQVPGSHKDGLEPVDVLRRRKVLNIPQGFLEQ
jgi:hypothetical protein